MQKLEMQYQHHPDEMTAQVERQELILKQKAEAMMKAEEAQKEADAWKQKAGDTPTKKPDAKKRSREKVKE